MSVVKGLVNILLSSRTLDSCLKDRIILTWRYNKHEEFNFPSASVLVKLKESYGCTAVRTLTIISYSVFSVKVTKLDFLPFFVSFDLFFVTYFSSLSFFKKLN